MWEKRERKEIEKRVRESEDSGGRGIIEKREREEGRRERKKMIERQGEREERIERGVRKRETEEGCVVGRFCSVNLWNKSSQYSTFILAFNTPEKRHQ